MTLKTAIIGLGSNLNRPKKQIKQALKKIRYSQNHRIFDFQSSNFYLTAPVSTIPQPDYINAVCSFQTNFTPNELLDYLESIEKEMGKTLKCKESPRIIDLDILFLGEEVYSDSRLVIPHPRWSERLFVVRPLMDLVECIIVNGEKIDLNALAHSESLLKQRVDKVDI